MTSNEHGAIEQNVKHHETNNLTYYTRESELHAGSYSIGNRGICCRISTLGEKNGRGEVNGGLPDLDRTSYRSSGSSLPARKEGEGAAVAGGGSGSRRWGSPAGAAGAGAGTGGRRGAAANGPAGPRRASRAGAVERAAATSVSAGFVGRPGRTCPARADFVRRREVEDARV